MPNYTVECVMRVRGTYRAANKEAAIQRARSEWQVGREPDDTSSFSVIACGELVATVAPKPNIDSMIRTTIAALHETWPHGISTGYQTVIGETACDFRYNEIDGWHLLSRTPHTQHE
jgi:hypothetical protein